VKYGSNFIQARYGLYSEDIWAGTVANDLKTRFVVVDESLNAEALTVLTIVREEDSLFSSVAPNTCCHVEITCIALSLQFFSGLDCQFCSELDHISSLLLCLPDVRVLHEQRERGFVCRGDNDACTTAKVQLMGVLDDVWVLHEVLPSPQWVIKFIISKCFDCVTHSTIDDCESVVTFK